MGIEGGGNGARYNDAAPLGGRGATRSEEHRECFLWTTTKARTHLSRHVQSGLCIPLVSGCFSLVRGKGVEPLSSGPLHGGANEAVIRMLISIGKSVSFARLVLSVDDSQRSCACEQT